VFRLAGVYEYIMKQGEFTPGCDSARGYALQIPDEAAVVTLERMGLIRKVGDNSKSDLGKDQT
jgi:hypothetical protein